MPDSRVINSSRLRRGSESRLAMQGIRDKAVLPPALQVDPGTLSAEEQSTRGIKPLASNLAEALSGFHADTGAQPRVPFALYITLDSDKMR